VPGESERLFALAERLVRSPSVTGDTEAALGEVEAFFRAAKVPTQRLLVQDTAPVLVAGDPPRAGLPMFVLATHLDTVPVVGSPSHPAGTVEEGKLFGRGAIDMKGGLALAMLLLQEFPRDPRFNLGFVATTDEEAESAGAWAVLDRMPPPDLVLVTEPTWEKVVLSASGRVVWQVRFEGKGGHGHHHKRLRASNPLVALAEIIGATQEEYTALRATTEGEGEVTLAHAASVRLDRILPAGRTIEADRAALQKIVGKVARKYPDLVGSLDLAPRKTPWLPFYETSKKDPWVARFLTAATRDGRQPEIVHKAAVGDYNVFGSKYPTLGLGPGGDGMHGDDEWLDLISLERCWNDYRRFFLSVPSAPAAAPSTR
jgi:acetylornithine deacetylase/succinyl-diaminopimelate desuccinylase-like protein